MPETNFKVLVVDDDPIVRQFLREALARQSYCIQEAATGQDALGKAAQWNPDVVVLDVGLPDMDGIAVAGRLRDWTSVPIIVLSSREQEETKILALDAGADDYVTKPIGIGELQARIRVALRRARQVDTPAEASVFAVDGLRIDLSLRQVTHHERAIKLTPTEFKLLAHLARNSGRVVRHAELLQSVWGPQYETETNYLRIYIKHLRTKIEEDPSNPRYILNEPGLGYRFVAEEASAS